MKTQTNSEIGTRRSEVGGRNGNARFKATLESIWNLKRIGMSRDDARTTRRFFNQHRHLLSDEIGRVMVQLSLVVAVGCLLLAIIAGLAVNLGLARGELRTLKQNDARVEAQRLALVHQVQTNNFVREGAGQ